jgi:hypothetical protein
MLQRQVFLLVMQLATGTMAAPFLTPRHTSFAPLRFTADGTFQISIFNDLHYGEGTK